MVAKITVPKSIEAALNYNEKKVQQGKAQCLHAANFLREAHQMNFYQKLDGFERLNSLNERAVSKTLHVSLNFDPSENLSENKLLEIASIYMDKIGFGNQPYLVYRHHDAGHPHIHIVSTTIKADGSRINTHNIGRNQSEKARKEIEQQYGLVKAEKQHQHRLSTVKPIDAEKAIYGKSETKRSISNIVSLVFAQYKFSSLPEFNAALKQFNVVADRGKAEGRIYKNRGLVYRIIDANGNKAGVPIKASSIAFKPTLDNLEKKYLENETAKEPSKQYIKNAIEASLLATPGTMKNLVAALEQHRIYTLLRQNETGRLYGITFVDNQHKVVFNGSDLGKGYSAAALQSRLNDPVQKSSAISEKNDVTASGAFQKNYAIERHPEKTIAQVSKTEGLVDILFATNQQYDNIPGNLLKKKRKKKRKYSNL